MMEIKLEKRVKYAGDVHAELMKAGFTPKGAAELLDHVPDADVQTVVHAKWENNKDEYPECTNCGYMPAFDPSIDDIYYSPFCPNCGSKMGGVQNETD